MGHNGNALKKRGMWGDSPKRGVHGGRNATPAKWPPSASRAGVASSTPTTCYQQQISRNRARKEGPRVNCWLTPARGAKAPNRDATGCNPLPSVTETRCAGGREPLAHGLFFEPTRETKRSASYTLLPAVFRAAAASVGLSCGMGWAVVLWPASRILGGGRTDC